MSRTYPLLLLNPMSDHADEIKKFIESGDLMLVDEVPSVTTISDSFGVSWGLVYSAAKLARDGKNFKEEWAKSADKGTRVHDIAESFALFGPAKIENINDYDEDIRGYVKGLIDWWSFYRPTATKTEFMVFDYGDSPPATCYAGRADLLATIAGKRTLIDYKTLGDSNHIAKYPKAFQSNNVEIVARAVAMEKAGKKVDQCMLVRLSPDGRHHEIFIGKDEWPHLYDCFKRMRAEWQFKKDHKWT